MSFSRSMMQFGDRDYAAFALEFAAARDERVDSEGRWRNVNIVDRLEGDDQRTVPAGRPMARPESDGHRVNNGQGVAGRQDSTGPRCAALPRRGATIPLNAGPGRLTLAGSHTIWRLERAIALARAIHGSERAHERAEEAGW